MCPSGLGSTLTPVRCLSLIYTTNGESVGIKRLSVLITGAKGWAIKKSAMYCLKIIYFFHFFPQATFYLHDMYIMVHGIVLFNRFYFKFKG